MTQREGEQRLPRLLAPISASPSLAPQPHASTLSWQPPRTLGLLRKSLDSTLPCSAEEAAPAGSDHPLRLACEEKVAAAAAAYEALQPHVAVEALLGERGDRLFVCLYLVCISYPHTTSQPLADSLPFPPCHVHADTPSFVVLPVKNKHDPHNIHPKQALPMPPTSTWTSRHPGQPSKREQTKRRRQQAALWSQSWRQAAFCQLP